MAPQMSIKITNAFMPQEFYDAKAMDKLYNDAIVPNAHMMKKLELTLDEFDARAKAKIAENRSDARDCLKISVVYADC